MKPVGIGIVGCGKISDAYFGNLKKFDGVATACCADLDARRAQAKAAQWDVPRHGTVDELLADPAVELVVNLTIPQAHADVDLRALRAGKHVYSEKPFATSLQEADEVIALATKARLDWDADGERFTNNNRANELLDYEYRPPWTHE